MSLREERCRKGLLYVIIILQSRLCFECCYCAAFKHMKETYVDSEWVGLRGRSVMVSFLLHSERTARGAKRSPSDLVESKRRVRGETTQKWKREQEMGSVSFIQNCNLGRWIASVAVRGSFLLYAIYTHNLTIKCGANRSVPAPAVSSVAAGVFDWVPAFGFIPH